MLRLCAFLEGAEDVLLFPAPAAGAGLTGAGQATGGVLRRGRPPPHRSVESAQYLAIRYTARLEEAGIVPSVGSKSDSFDNALAETVNGLYKAELIRRRGPWRTAAEVAVATAAWVAWWNTQRLHGALGYLPPAEYEAAHRPAPATAVA